MVGVSLLKMRVWALGWAHTLSDSLGTVGAVFLWGMDEEIVTHLQSPVLLGCAPQLPLPGWLLYISGEILKAQSVHQCNSLVPYFVIPIPTITSFSLFASVIWDCKCERGLAHLFRLLLIPLHRSFAYITQKKYRAHRWHHQPDLWPPGWASDIPLTLSPVLH